MSRAMSTTATTSGNTHVAVYDLTASEQAVYDDLSPPTRAAYLAARGADRTAMYANTTCIGLDQYRTRNLSQALREQDTPDELALGVSDAATAYEDTALSDEVGRTDVSSYEVIGDGTTLLMSAHLDTNQLNGETLVEGGLVSERGRLLTHLTFDPIDKTPTRAATFTIRLTFDTAGGTA